MIRQLLLKIVLTACRFNLFLPLHQLWMGYMSELLGLQQKPSQGVETEVARKAMPNASGMHPKLLKADFHGSLMTGIDL